jgi:hypothetical protein
MIRGSIEIAGRSLVSGWLYSPVVDLRGRLVLAFVGDRFVGGGRVEITRRDIKAAGLGDGTSGFYFPVSLQPGEDPGSIVVRLENSDLSLLQAHALVVVEPPSNGGGSLAARSDRFQVAQTSR